MEDTKHLYNQLTGIDIDEQRRIWDERGKGYYGEYLVFKELIGEVMGQCKFLMNLKIPMTDHSTTELDLVMIHETGLYVFEIKHYKGNVYGNVNDSVWTQFFKTTNNNTFKNPVQQNAYHMRAVKSLMPTTKLFSAIVFTHDDVHLHIDNDNPELMITTLKGLKATINNVIRAQNSIYSMEDIEKMYVYLAQFSPKLDDVIGKDGVVEPFEKYLTQLRKDLEQEKHQYIQRRNEADETISQYNDLNEQLTKRNQNFNKSKKYWIIGVVCAVLAVAIALGTVFVYKANDYYQNKYNKAVQAFANKFERIDEINDSIYKVDGIVEISNVKLIQSTELNNTVEASITITNIGKKYGIKLTDGMQYVVHLSNGEVKEYLLDLDSKPETDSYVLLKPKNISMYNTKFDLTRLYIYEVDDVSEIEYVKIIGVQIVDCTTSFNDIVSENAEIEVYKKSGNE